MAGHSGSGDNDADLQRAIMLSLGGADAGPAAAEEGGGDDVVAGLADHPAARALLHTVLGNLVDNLGDPKFRRVKDAAVQKRCGEGGGYLEATVALTSLGFVVLDEGDAPCWWLAEEPEGSTLDRLRDARRRLAADATGPAGAASATAPGAAAAAAAAASSRGPQVPLADLARPAVLSVASSYGPLCVLAYPDTCVQLVGATDFPGWAASGSGRHRGLQSGLRADHRALLSVCNCCEGLGVAAHWIDWNGSERTAPNLVCQPQRTEMVQTHSLHSFSLRLYPQQQVVICGLRVTERPHHTGGHVVVFIVRGSPESVDCSAFARRCQRTIELAGEDPRDPPEAAGRQGRAPAPPPPGANRGKFWGS